jgi:Ca-activated chloride channel family protein
VLFTDGEDNDAGALEAAQNAAKAGLKIFTIGIGSSEGVLLDPNLVRDPEGNAVKSHLNETLLQQIASATGGFYLPLRGADTINTFYERGLEPLPKSSGPEKLVRRYREQFQWPLVAAVLLLLSEMFLPERRSLDRREPKNQSKSAALSAVSMAILATLLSLALCGKTIASPATALNDYKTGHYTNAFQEFKQLAEMNTNDLRLVFNMGAAAYRATNFDEALHNFKLVAAAPDLKLQQQAYYNLGNTLYRMGELKFEPNTEGLDAMTETWQQAVKNYEHAGQLSTNDMDAAYNLNFVKQQIGLIAQLREAMRRAKMDADAAVRRAEFHRAVEIMDSLSQNKIAAKKFEDYTKKLKDIDAIATPHQP